MTTRSSPAVPSEIAAVSAAAFTFLCALGVGTALVVGAKLQVTGLGAGASPWAIFEAIALVALGALGAPVEVGGVRVQVLPLGGIALVGWGALSAIQQAGNRTRNFSDDSGDAGEVPEPARTTPPRSPRRRVRWGLLFAGSFALLCAGAAAIARFRIGEEEVRVSLATAALAGAGWGSLFALAAWLVEGSGRFRLSEPWRGAAAAGRTALGWFGALCLGVVVVGGLVRVVTQSPSPAAAAGTLLHGAAFAPNLATATGAISLGAPVEAGFGSLAEADVGRAPTYSLLDWDGSATPIAAWALLLLPAVALILAGRRVERLSHLLLAALALALVCVVLALLGEARIGLDADDQGFARLAPDAARTFLLALGWALVGLSLGWLLRARRNRREVGDRDISR